MEIQLFKYEEKNHINDLTTVEINGEIWFVAADACSVLDIVNTTQAIKSLDDDEKLPYVLDRAGQKRSVNLLSESGLYSLIFKSKKPEAKRFRKWITREVIPAIRKTGSYGIDRGTTPNFVVRFNDNWDKIDRGYFSVISELFVRLHGKLEQAGYIIPDKALNGREIRPDVSVGKGFATFLRNNYPDLENSFKHYPHRFPNGVTIQARQYPIELLPMFIRYIDENWMYHKAVAYFEERDKVALNYLPKLLTQGETTSRTEFDNKLLKALNYTLGKEKNR